ncbi:MAG: hypothetical protein HY268_15490, partial [Deltaproteobacteria bacterium]|nr:hypothetical protein [Deltaproteobacteria bacterium]
MNYHEIVMHPGMVRGWTLPSGNCKLLPDPIAPNALSEEGEEEFATRAQTTYALIMMRQRKTPEVSRPTVVIRKKKPQPTTTVGANNGQSTASTPQAPRPVPIPTTKPSPQRTVSPPVQTKAQFTQQPSQVTPPQPNHRQRDAQAQKELLEVFRARWPAVFPYDRQYLKPLMRGVHHEIAKHLVGTSLSLIKRTIVLFQRHSGGGYWRAVL